MTASDPADEATGVVSDDGSRTAAPSGPVDDLAIASDPAAPASESAAPFAADRLFAGDTPPSDPSVVSAVPVDAAAIGALFTVDRTPARRRGTASSDDPAPASDREPVLDPEPVDAPATPPLTKPPFHPRRRGEGEEAQEPDEAEALVDGAAVQWADDKTGATALTWVDAAAVGAHTATATFEQTPETEQNGGLLRGARLRPAIARPGILVPLVALTALVAGYAGTTLLWPLHEIPPTAQT
ncbi:MAG: hypothetical protein CVT61_02295, partial [Actinobacteria bacterium HGW-Actinobacteria-11]